MIVIVTMHNIMHLTLQYKIIYSGCSNNYYHDMHNDATNLTDQKGEKMPMYTYMYSTAACSMIG